MIQNSVPNKRFPQSLITMCVVLEESCCYAPPLEVQNIYLASNKALLADNPRTSINKQFNKLKKNNSSLIPAVLDWLKDPVTKGYFSQCGAYWANINLISAFEKIIDGVSPHTAFGMSTGGRPQFWEFTVMEDAAIYAQHLHLNKKLKIDEAKIESAQIFGTDKSNINKVKMKITDKADALNQANCIINKHKLS